MADEAGAERGAAGGDTPVRVFISYSWDSDAHKTRVRSLADELRSRNIDCRIDQYHGLPDMQWYELCEKEIAEATFVLVVVTKKYKALADRKVKGDYGYGVMHELNAIRNDLAKNKSLTNKYIPVFFSGTNKSSIPDLFSGRTFFHLKTKDDFNGLVSKIIRRGLPEMPPLGGCNQSTVLDPGFLAPSRAPNPVNRPWFVPHSENRFFTGRRDELDALHAALHGGGRAAICQAISGLGGIGKTQTAVRYCYDQRDAYAAVFWLRAQSLDTLTADVQAVARELGLPEAGAGDQSATIRAVQRWLRDNAGWLLVLDNVDTDDMAAACRDFLPTGLRGGAVLITSRLDDLTELNVADPLKLPVLPEDEAVAFLLQRTGRKAPSPAERDAARRLARDLGCLPLALEQAAAYCKASRLTFDQYWERFKEAGLALLEKGRVKAGSYEKTIATTWALSIAEVAKECPAAVDVLKVCSMLAPEAIPLEVIREGGARMGPTVAAAIEDGVEAVLAPLAKYSLIDWEAGAEDFSMHRLVQCSTREAMAEDEKKKHAEQAVEAVNAAFSNVEFEAWPLCERLAPPCLCVSEMDGYVRNSNHFGGKAMQSSRLLFFRPRPVCRSGIILSPRPCYQKRDHGAGPP